MAHELESGTGKLIRPAYARRKQPTSSLMADEHTTPALTELDHAEIVVDSGNASASEHKTLLPHNAVSSSLGRYARTAMHGLVAALGVVAIVMGCLAVDKHVSHIFLAADPPSDNSGGGAATLAAVQSQEFVKRVATTLLQGGNDTNALVPLLVAGFLQHPNITWLLGSSGSSAGGGSSGGSGGGSANVNETALIESVVAAVLSTAASMLATDGTFASPTLVDPSIVGNVTWSDASLDTLHVHTLDATQLHGTDVNVDSALTVHGSTTVTAMEAHALNASLHVRTPRVQADRIESIGTRLILGDSLHTEEIQIGGRSHANVIRVGGGTVQSHLYLGGVNDMVYIQGNTSIVSTTNHAVENKRFVLNAGGLAESSGLAGLYFEDDGQTDLAFVRLAQDLLSIELKALQGPLVVLDQNLATTADVQFHRATIETLDSAAVLCDSLQAAHNVTVGENLHVGHGITATTLTSLDVAHLHTVHIHDDLTIQGALHATAGSATLGTATLTSLTVSGPSTLDDTTAAALTAASLAVAGESALHNTHVAMLDAQSLRVDGPAALNDTTTTTLATTTLAVSGASVLDATNTTALLATSLEVVGPTMLRSTSTAALSAESLVVAGDTILSATLYGDSVHVGAVVATSLNTTNGRIDGGTFSGTALTTNGGPISGGALTVASVDSASGELTFGSSVEVNIAVSGSATEVNFATGTQDKSVTIGSSGDTIVLAADSQVNGALSVANGITSDTLAVQSTVIADTLGFSGTRALIATDNGLTSIVIGNGTSAKTIAIGNTDTIVQFPGQRIAFAHGAAAKKIDWGAVDISYTSTVTYMLGDVAWSSAQSYQSLINNNINRAPEINSHPAGTVEQALINTTTVVVGASTGTPNTILGSHFIVNVNCVLTKVRFHRMAGNTGALVYVWQIASNGASATLMATLTDPDVNPATGSWRDLALTTPLQLLVGERWTVARQTTGGPVSESNTLGNSTFVSPTLIGGSQNSFVASGWPNTATTNAKNAYITPVVQSAWTQVSDITTGYPAINDVQYNGMATDTNKIVYQAAQGSISHVFQAALTESTSVELFRITGTGALSSALATSSLTLAGTSAASIQTAGGIRASNALGFSATTVNLAVDDQITVFNLATGTSDKTINVGTTGDTVVMAGNRLTMPNTLALRKIDLGSGTSSPDYRYNGFGSTTNTLLYSIESTGWQHLFVAGSGTSSWTELFRIGGNGAISTTTTGSTFTMAGTGASSIATAGGVVLSGTSAVLNLQGASSSITVSGTGATSIVTAGGIRSTGASAVLSMTGTSSSVAISGTGAASVTTAGGVQLASTLLFTPASNLQKKVVLRENDGASSTTFYGFGVNAGILYYSVADTTANHVFYAGTGANTNAELFRILGTGGGATTTGPLTASALVLTSATVTLGAHPSNTQVELGTGDSVAAVYIASGATVKTITIGTAGDTVLIPGTLTAVTTTNAAITDAQLVLNKGGSAGSSGGSGLYFEEDAVTNVGYIKVSTNRLAFDIKAPAGTAWSLNQALSTSSTPTFAGMTVAGALQVAGAVVLTSTFSGTTLIGTSLSVGTGSIASGDVTSSGTVTAIAMQATTRFTTGASALANRKVVVYQPSGDDDHQYNGLGDGASNEFRFQIKTSSDSFKWYSALSSTSSQLIYTMTGAGAISTSLSTSSFTMAGTGAASIATAGGISMTGASAVLALAGASSAITVASTLATSVSTSGGVVLASTLLFSPASNLQKKVVLRDDNVASTTTFFGFGVNANELYYGTADSFASHVFYAGTGINTNVELFRIHGSGGGATASGPLTANSLTLTGSSISIGAFSANTELYLGTGPLVSTIGIGTAGSVPLQITLGTASTIVNIPGTLNTVTTTNTAITDAQLVLNKGGAVDSAVGSGLFFEEDAIQTGYFKVSANRLAFDFKAPAGSEFSLNQGLLTTSSPTFSSLTLGSGALTCGSVTATGQIAAATLTVTGALGSGAITTTGTITGPSLVVTGTSATSIQTAGGVTAAGTLTATGVVLTGTGGMSVTVTNVPQGNMVFSVTSGGINIHGGDKVLSFTNPNTATGIRLPTINGGAAILNYFEQGGATITWASTSAGFGVVSTLVLSITRLNNVLTMHVPSSSLHSTTQQGCYRASQAGVSQRYRTINGKQTAFFMAYSNGVPSMGTFSYEQSAGTAVVVLCYGLTSEGAERPFPAGTIGTGGWIGTRWDSFSFSYYGNG
jgi:hypothetical protein